MDMECYVSMPKVELHAHLNGSVRDSTLLELAKDLGEKGIIVFSDVEHVILKNDRSLVEVFKLFDLIHILTTDHNTVTRITKEVVEDFAAENVVYLELRTTPKRNELKGMTKRSYVEAVIEGLRGVCAVDIDFAPADIELEKWDATCMNNASNGLTRKKIYVRLLLSIDRRETLEAALETVKLALEMRGNGVVGIDLSGNPRVGDWKTFLLALVFAREQGLRVTLHCGEVPNQEEIHGMLDFHPERIGHACCLEEDAWNKLKSMKIPVEICLTSNIRTNTISSVDAHHFADLYKLKHPMTLCTDDSGVFSTSLSKEYAIAATAFNLGKKEMFQLARNAVDFSFAEERVVKQLKKLFDIAE
ncbi:N6-mAMP deaminase [Silene latifolia]|uniref:N6-mAMP deaminase n=1 Tax=Silene latifolia TaxID=37657 RepID=UPI003D777DC4